MAVLSSYQLQWACYSVEGSWLFTYRRTASYRSQLLTLREPFMLFTVNGINDKGEEYPGKAHTFSSNCIARKRQTCSVQEQILRIHFKFPAL